MTDKPQGASLRDRALTGMIRAAFFSWQAGLIIAICIVLAAFNIQLLGLPSAAWLLFGLIGVIVYIGVTINDPQAQKQIIGQMLRERYEPNRIKNPAARGRIEKALEYYSAIQSLIATRSGASQVEFQHTLQEIDDWIAYLFELGQRVDRFDENKIINRDRMQSRTELDALQRRLEAEPDERVKAEIRRSIQIKETQLENLKTLENNVKRADIQMDNTLAALGTVYAQMQLIGSKDLDSGRAQRLRNEVHDQVMSLQDTIAAIDEVQSHSAY